MEAAWARGYLSLRRAARWLRDRYGWEATEEGVVSAIRRYDPPTRLELAHGPRLLARSTVTTGPRPGQRPDDPPIGEDGVRLTLTFPEAARRALLGTVAATNLLAHGAVGVQELRFLGRESPFLVPAEDLAAASSLLAGSTDLAPSTGGDR